MHIEEKRIPIREIFEGYKDDQENGVVGYGGRLDIRPAYQREFIYGVKERDAVITTVKRGFPLNTMYWAKSGEDSYELMDGQQRTISICQYLDNMFEHEGHLFDGLTETEKTEILDKYKLMVYVCEGTDKEKLEWFRVINIAGKPLTAQELRNAIYTGEWLTDAKGYFSRTNCPAQESAKKYLNGSAIRQDYLETALRWISDRDGVSIEKYMALHQLDSSAADLWLYFDSVMSWVKTLFPVYRKEMKGIEWGLLYNEHHGKSFDPKKLEERIVQLMSDDDVQDQKGIYPYLLDGQEKHLNIRAFTPAMKRAAYEMQAGRCAHCHEPFPIEEMEGHHRKPWCEGGHTKVENCDMLCKTCHRNTFGH